MIILQLSPSGQSAQQLCTIFSYPWKFIEGEPTEDGRLNWRTIKNYPLKPRSLWAKYLDPLVQIGTRFAKRTSYALLDIDKGSQYRSPAGVGKVRAALETIGLTDSLLLRSSDSGGLHLYYPLPVDVSTFNLACSIEHCLKAHGMELQPSRLESFPNAKRYARADLDQFSEYNGHRLPLQAGSGGCLLDDELNPRGASLERFLWEWEEIAARQDMPALNAALPIGRANHWPKRKRRYQVTDQWRTDVEGEIAQGFTGPGQTNAFIKSVGCYCRVFLGLAGDELRERMEPMVILAPGFEQHCGHQAEIEIRIASWANAIERYYWPLGSEPQRLIDRLNINIERAKEARARISAAVCGLVKAGDLADGIRARRDQIVAIARCSGQTLQKCMELWHPLARCVPALTVSLTADPPPFDGEPLNRLKPPPATLVHTFRRIMKCVVPDTPLKSNISLLRRGGEGGEGFTQVHLF